MLAGPTVLRTQRQTEIRTEPGADGTSHDICVRAACNVGQTFGKRRSGTTTGFWKRNDRLGSFEERELQAEGL